MIAGLKIAKDLGVKHMRAFTDSQLVVGQSRGEFKARDPILFRYLQKLKSLQTNFDYFKILYIPCSENARVDSLSRLATSGYDQLGKILVEYLKHSSINIEEKIWQTRVGRESSWIDPILRFIDNKILPTDLLEA